MRTCRFQCDQVITLFPREVEGHPFCRPHGVPGADPFDQLVDLHTAHLAAPEEALNTGGTLDSPPQPDGAVSVQHRDYPEIKVVCIPASIRASRITAESEGNRVQLTSHPLFHPLTSIRSARQWLIDMPRRSEAYVAKISLQPVTVTTAAPVDSAVMSRVGGASHVRSRGCGGGVFCSAVLDSISTE
jgi:hypothetical protein